jgi:hypothetical protein
MSYTNMRGRRTLPGGTSPTALSTICITSAVSLSLLNWSICTPAAASDSANPAPPILLTLLLLLLLPWSM